MTTMPVRLSWSQMSQSMLHLETKCLLNALWGVKSRAKKKDALKIQFIDVAGKAFASESTEIAIVAKKS